MSEVTDKWLDDQIAALEQTGGGTGEWIVYPVVLHRALCELRERRKQDAKPAMNGIGAARVVAEPTMDGTVSAQYSAAALAHDAEVFGDVSIVELARCVEALGQRLEVIERWRTAFIDQENDGCSEYMLPKWARRLKKMGGTLQFSWLGIWTVVIPPERGDEVEAYFDGVTPQAAVEAAWYEWKGARR